MDSKIIDRLIAEVDNQLFENMILLHYSDVGRMAIKSDTNIQGNIKYYDLYNEITMGVELLAIVLSGEEPSFETLEASNPDYSEYIIYSKTEEDILELLSWLYAQSDEYVPYFLKALKEKINTMPEIFEED